MTSATMRCVSHAVAVVGLTITGTPESSAGAAFSHRPQDGKLNALIKRAMPRVGTITCCELNVLSLPNFTRAPSSNARVSPRAAPHLAYCPSVKIAPSMSTAESFLVVPEFAVAIS